MFTEKQLIIAAGILEHINDEGGIAKDKSFENLFNKGITDSDERINIERQVHFVTACLFKDFNLIRIVRGELMEIATPFTALTLEGAKAIDKGVPAYLKKIERKKRRDARRLSFSFWASMIALLILLIKFIIDYN